MTVLELVWDLVQPTNRAPWLNWLNGEEPCQCLLSGSPPDWLLATESMRELFEERAGIGEFDGGLSRDEAERQARGVLH